MTTTRILRTQAVTLSHVFDPAEIPTDADGTVGVSLARLDGTVVTAGNATGPDGEHRYTYPYAGSATLDHLTVTWTATVAGDALTLDQDQLEIVGGFWFGIAEARKADPALASLGKFPTTDLEGYRIEVEDEGERICGQAFVPRFAREILDGTGRPSLRLRWPWIRTVRKVAISNIYGDPMIDLTADQLRRVAPGDDGVLRLDDGFLWAATGWTWGTVWPPGRRNVLVEYEHGRDVPPADIRRAGRIRIKSLALQPLSALPDRAERIAVTEAGTVLLAVATRDTVGLPEVDGAYARYPDPRPGFG